MSYSFQYTHIDDLVDERESFGHVAAVRITDTESHCVDNTDAISTWTFSYPNSLFSYIGKSVHIGDA